MHVKTIGFVLSTWLVAAGWTAAQNGKNGDKEPGERRTGRARMYEDIEILRRILLGKLQKVYAPLAVENRHVLTYPKNGGGDVKRGQMVGAYVAPKETLVTRSGGFSGEGGYAPANYTTLNEYLVPSSSWFSGLEGVYLKGQGVVYTMTLPPLAGDPRVLGTERPSKPLSDWERMRKEIRHEKVDAATREGRGKKPSLTETILKVLAENGHHFTRLDDRETVTVAVTFRSPSLIDRISTLEILQQVVRADPKGTLWTNKPLGEKSNAATPEQLAHALRDYELLGDLHLRQGKAQEALASYARLLQVLKKFPDKQQDAKQVANLYGKVAQAYLSLQQNDAARKAVEMSLVYLKRIEANETKPAKGGKGQSSPSLPAKLIISASKKVLDQAGAGKMTFAEFVKEAQVEYLPFTAKAKEANKE
jgi:hypothetical protein